ncbi:hypothetical protein [Pedobacter sp. SYSU D00535]|uniref:hypothetical protein n=1 Tax=Pedobacter sp. SYSU D00535 TaxID=2810308 RepID=UPI001A963784|nr:hypothetical protein [Pedobacter sp. SYSU D00535]
MTKLLKTFFPTLLGVLTIWGLLKIESIFHTRQFGPDEDVQIDSDLILILPVTIIALIIQYILTIPVWNKFKRNKVVLGLAIRPFFIVLCIVGGLIFGLLFWHQQLGIKDLVISSFLGIIALAIYWTINLLTLKKIDIWLTK